MGSVGNASRALALAQTAVARDPLNAYAYISLGNALNWRRASDHEAEAAFRQAANPSPQGAGIQRNIAVVLSNQGQHQEALSVCALEQADSLRLDSQAIIHYRIGQFVESDLALNEMLERERNRGSNSTWAFQLARVFGDRGDADHAFAWLDTGFVERDSGCAQVKLSPYFRSLHDDPRWAAFLTKMGFPD